MPIFRIFVGQLRMNLPMKKVTKLLVTFFNNIILLHFKLYINICPLYYYITLHYYKNVYILINLHKNLRKEITLFLVLSLCFFLFCIFIFTESITFLFCITRFDIAIHFDTARYCKKIRLFN